MDIFVCDGACAGNELGDCNHGDSNDGLGGRGRAFWCDKQIGKITMRKPLQAVKTIGDTWTLYVNGSPIVQLPITHNLTYKGRKDYVEGCITYQFKTGDEVEAMAHFIGRYHLKLGDLLFSYLHIG